MQRDSFDKLYYLEEHWCDCYKIQNGVVTCEIDRGHKFDHTIDNVTETHMVQSALKGLPASGTSQKPRIQNFLERWSSSDI